VRPWPDAVIDRVGYDPRSPYVERFWLGVLGPSSIVLLRRLATELEANPAGFVLGLDATARSLGLAVRGGRGSTFGRTMLRCSQFRLLHYDEPGGTLLVRRKLPPLTRSQVAKLPPAVQDAHQQWVTRANDDAADQLRRRACRLALSLLELGEDAESCERQLHRWKFHPGIAREATAWAWRRHQDAAAATAALAATDA
jgi:hypothetical protein